MKNQHHILINGSVQFRNFNYSLRYMYQKSVVKTVTYGKNFVRFKRVRRYGTVSLMTSARLETTKSLRD
jgi:hypothetical protein